MTLTSKPEGHQTYIEHHQWHHLNLHLGGPNEELFGNHEKVSCGCKVGYIGCQGKTLANH